MARGLAPGTSRSAGLVPLLGGIASAMALTGAAFYTVEQATCTDPGRYIRHDTHVELAGGCFDGAELPQDGTVRQGERFDATGAPAPNRLRP